MRRSHWSDAAVADHNLKVVGVGWMRVSADLQSTKDNAKLVAQSIGHKLVGK